MQEYVFISLDNFHGILHNNGIRNQLEAWLTFLSVDEPETIAKLIREYPQFEKYYEEIYELCRNTERVMQMFSEELRELDRNTVQYMIDDMKDEIDAQKQELKEQKDLLNQKDDTINAQKNTIDVQKSTIDVQKEKIAEQGELLSQKDGRINAQNKEIEELKRQLAQLQAEAK